MTDVLDGILATLDERDADRVRETFEWIAPHCDLEERLPQVPPSARLRGVWDKIIEQQLAERGLLGEYRRLIPPPRASALKLHPLSEFLVRAAVAGALVRGPDDLHAGMFVIARGNARRFSSSLMGAALVQLLARDPRRLSLQGLAARRETCHYGQWRLVSASHDHVQVEMIEEYIWLDSYLAGAAAGTYELIGNDVEVEVQMHGAFHGTMTIHWR